VSVYVGELVKVSATGRGKYAWAARLEADDLVELLIFASRIGVARCWLIEEGEPHFLLTPGCHRKALKCGALPMRERGKRRGKGMKAPLFEGLE
jgi:hypothetical protein